MDEELQKFMTRLISRTPAQEEFHQAVHEVARYVLPFMRHHPKYEKVSILERLTEPDRIIIFRVCWEDDTGKIRVNRGYRVQFNNAIGPYKGGLRFDKSVRLSILKFLAFEQVFKNALTSLPMGGAKGGSDFNPKGKSDREIMRFCQSFMTELYRHIGKDCDVPAGDMGCGPREISFLFGQYKRICNRFTGTITGKGLAFGGSPIRTEATGYGSVYFAREMLRHNHHDDLEGKTCVVSGSGNVAQYTIEKLNDLGARAVTVSDTGGFVHDPAGIDKEKLEYLKELKGSRHGSLAEYADHFHCQYYPDQKPWHVACDLAFPSATQNELDGDAARALVKNGCRLVSEGANMPTTTEGTQVFQDAKVLYGPGKAANAGGVAISGLEMAQNSMRLTWPREEVDRRLQEIMRHIHEQCVEYGQDGDLVNYVRGANIAAFLKVSDAMMAYGVV